MSRARKGHEVKAKTARLGLTTHRADVSIRETRRVFFRQFNIPPWTQYVFVLVGSATGLLLGDLWGFVASFLFTTLTSLGVPWIGGRRIIREKLVERMVFGDGVEERVNVEVKPGAGGGSWKRDGHGSEKAHE